MDGNITKANSTTIKSKDSVLSTSQTEISSVDALRPTRLKDSVHFTLVNKEEISTEYGSKMYIRDDHNNIFMR